MITIRPLRGREFFEEIVRENLDLGRPDRVQLTFDGVVTRNGLSRNANLQIIWRMGLLCVARIRWCLEISSLRGGIGSASVSGLRYEIAG